MDLDFRPTEINYFNLCQKGSRTTPFGLCTQELDQMIFKSCICAMIIGTFGAQLNLLFFFQNFLFGY